MFEFEDEQAAEIDKLKHRIHELECNELRFLEADKYGLTAKEVHMQNHLNKLSAVISEQSYEIAALKRKLQEKNYATR